MWHVTCATLSLDVRTPRPSCCRITLCMTTRVPSSWFQGFLLSMTSLILKYSRLHSVGNTIMVSTIYFQICHYFPGIPDVEPLLWEHQDRLPPSYLLGAPFVGLHGFHLLAVLHQKQSKALQSRINCGAVTLQSCHHRSFWPHCRITSIQLSVGFIARFAA